MPTLKLLSNKIYSLKIKKKASANYNFPNLSYLVDGDNTIAESEAVLVHICLKAGKKEMTGKIEDKVEFIQLKNVINDAFGLITRNCYNSKDKETLKKNIEILNNIALIR